MNALDYSRAIRLSTMAAMKAGLSLPEIVGVLEVSKANAIAVASAAAKEKQETKIVRLPPPIPPGLSGAAG